MAKNVDLDSAVQMMLEPASDDDEFSDEFVSSEDESSDENDVQLDLDFGVDVPADDDISGSSAAEEDEPEAVEEDWQPPGRGRALRARARAARHHPYRGRARGAGAPGRGRAAVGRQRGQGRGGPAPVNLSEWENINPGSAPVDFEPNRAEGLHLPDGFVPENEIDFFNLFFSEDVVESLVSFTNAYAWMHILSRPSHALPDGSWKEISSQEMRNFFALLLYFGLIRIPEVDKYWSTRTLYHRLWARELLSRQRFRAVRSFFSVLGGRGW